MTSIMYVCSYSHVQLLSAIGSKIKVLGITGAYNQRAVERGIVVKIWIISSVE